MNYRALDHDPEDAAFTAHVIGKIMADYLADRNGTRTGPPEPGPGGTVGRVLGWEHDT